MVSAKLCTLKEAPELKDLPSTPQDKKSSEVEYPYMYKADSAQNNALKRSGESISISLKCGHAVLKVSAIDRVASVHPATVIAPFPILDLAHF